MSATRRGSAATASLRPGCRSTGRRSATRTIASTATSTTTRSQHNAPMQPVSLGAVQEFKILSESVFGGVRRHLGGAAGLDDEVGIEHVSRREIRAGAARGVQRGSAARGDARRRTTLCAEWRVDWRADRARADVLLRQRRDDAPESRLGDHLARSVDVRQASSANTSDWAGSIIRSGTIEHARVSASTGIGRRTTIPTIASAASNPAERGDSARASRRSARRSATAR